MKESRFIDYAGKAAFVAAAYFLAAKSGLKLASVHASATPVWPPTGIAFVALFILGLGFWPAIWIAAFLANITTAGSLLTSIGIASGNTLEAVAGVWLVNRFCQRPNPFQRPADFFKFVALAGIASTLISATLGVTSLAITGFARWHDFGAIWFTWWLGDMAGDLVVAPLLILWAAPQSIHWNAARITEASLMIASLLFVGLELFGGLTRFSIKNDPLTFFTLPPLVWAASRFGPREAITSVTLLSAMAILGTIRGFGPFVQATPNESLLLLQAFLGVNSVMIMALAANVNERRAAAAAQRSSEERFRQIAETITEVFYLMDVRDGRLIYISPAYESVWRRTCQSLYDNPESFMDSILPEHRPRVAQALERQNAGELTAEEYAIRRPDGRIRWIRDRAFPLRDETGKVYRTTGIAEDITERKENQDGITAALREKEVMLSELNHRVKNNLQVISSFMYLQADRITDPTTRRTLLESHNRVRSMALVHENLYKSPNLSRIDFGDYVRKLTNDIFRSYGIQPETVRLSLNIPITFLPVNLAVTCGLIVNELISNSLKHAFIDGRIGEIAIDLIEQGDKRITIVVRDNGVGLANGFDALGTTSLGCQIVTCLVKQLKGTLDVRSQNGAEFRFTFTRPADA